MNETPTASRRFPVAWLVLLLVLVVAAAGGWLGWKQWTSYRAQQQNQSDETLQRWQNMDQLLSALRRDQRAASERVQDTAATNRILRDEMLALSQRGALLEETVTRLSDPNRHGAQALRLDEVELLLNQGQQRLAIAGDLDGARRAYALAAGVLQGIDDPSYLNLRQTLIQERNALDAAGRGAQSELASALDAFATQLKALPERIADDSAADRPWWQQALSPLVEIRPSRGGALVSASDRVGAQDALQIEVSLARAALERNDEAGYRQALTRIDTWMTRLWPDSPPLRQRRAELSSLAGKPLRPKIPELGTTLLQLQAMRERRTEQ